MSLHEKHLADIRSKGREREALNRLIPEPSTADSLWAWCGLNPWVAWKGIELPFDRLLPRDLRREPDGSMLDGDVDLLIAPLEWSIDVRSAEFVQRVRANPELATWERLAGSCPGGFASVLLRHGFLTWPPRIRAVAAFEVKVSYWTLDGQLRAAQDDDRQRIRQQARKLWRLGFPKVGILRIVATVPNPAPRGSPWLDPDFDVFELLDELARRHLSQPGDPFTEFAWPVLSIAGKLEDEAGGATVQVLREADASSAEDEELRARRFEAISKRLGAAMASWSSPVSAECFMLSCDRCQRLFHAIRPSKSTCARCREEG